MNKLFKIFMLFIMPVLLGLVVSCKDDEDKGVTPLTPSPTISSVNPMEGPVGTTVTITGTNLKEVTAVKFGSADAANFTAANNTATSITATVPEGLAAGAQNITVTSAAGSATANFTVTEAEPEPEPVAMTIVSFNPMRGPAGTVVSLKGTNLNGENISSVKLGDLILEDAQVVNADTITFTIPEGAQSGKITIAPVEGDAVVSEDEFTVADPLPLISSVNGVSRSVGEWLIISGSHLNLVTTVMLGDIEVTDFTAEEDGTKLTLTVPQNAVTGKIILINNAGEEVVSAEALTVVPAPPFVFSPRVGPVGTEITVSGADFTGVSSVMLGTTEISGVVVAEDNQALTFVVPAGATSGKITVGDLVSTRSFFVIEEEGLVADFDTNTLLKWPKNGAADWGWGIPNENFTDAAEGIQPIDGYYALINMAIAPARGWHNEKVINLVDWYGGQIFPEAPKTTYDPAAPISNFVATMDIAVAQPSSLDGLVLQIGTYNKDGQLLTTRINLTDVIGATDGTWHNVSIPLSGLSKGLATFNTYGDLLSGGLIDPGTGKLLHHLQIVIDNTNAEGTDPIPATIAFDNIKIVKAAE